MARAWNPPARAIIGIALGSPVSLDYCDKAPLKFNGMIEQVHVKYVMEN